MAAKKQFLSFSAVAMLKNILQTQFAIKPKSPEPATDARLLVLFRRLPGLVDLSVFFLKPCGLDDLALSIFSLLLDSLLLETGGTSTGRS